MFLVTRILCQGWLSGVDLSLRNWEQRLECRYAHYRHSGSSAHQIGPSVAFERKLEPTLARDCSQHTGLCQTDNRVCRQSSAHPQPIVFGYCLG